MAASKTILHSILLVCCISIFVVQGRILRLNSSEIDDQFLISDGVDHHGRDESKLSTFLGASTCNPHYGFMPCAENIPGYIFQVIVYQFLLKLFEEQIDRGSKELFNIIGETKVCPVFNIIGEAKVGLVIYRFLMVLPSMVFMIVSGAFSSKENAQSTVTVSVGVFAGVTVFSLTYQWGMTLWAIGAIKLNDKSNDRAEDSTSSCSPGRVLTILKGLADYGVEIDKQTRETGGIMLLSLIPYVIVELVNIFRSSSANRVITTGALIVSVLMLAYYFFHQVTSTWMQERSLAYSNYSILKKRFLEHIQEDGQFLAEDGKIDTDAIHKVFVKVDTNQDNCLTKDETRELVQDLIKKEKIQVDQEECAVEQIMTKFDFDNSGSISKKEFVDRCKSWLNDIQKSSQRSEPNFGELVHEAVQSMKKKKRDKDPVEIYRIMTTILTQTKTVELKSKSLITDDGKPDLEGIKSLFNHFDRDGNKSISRSEVQEVVSNIKFGKIHRKPEEIVNVILEKLDANRDGTINELEFEDGISKSAIAWKQLTYGRWILVKSLIRVVFGTVMMILLGGPLIDNMLSLSDATGAPSFSTSFYVIPITMNGRALAAALLSAKKKDKMSAPRTFSEIYSSVTMNNIVGLTSLLFIVYFKGLTWDFSIEVLTILFVCAIIGLMAYKCHSYPLWILLFCSRLLGSELTSELVILLVDLNMRSSGYASVMTNS